VRVRVRVRARARAKIKLLIERVGEKACRSDIRF